MHQLTEAIRASNLAPEIGEMLIDNISGNQWLVVALEKGQLSIKKLRALFNIITESSENRRKRQRGCDETPGNIEAANESSEVTDDNRGDDGKCANNQTKPKNQKQCVFYLSEAF